jgi:hypothetical protein
VVWNLGRDEMKVAFDTSLPSEVHLRFLPDGSHRVANGAAEPQRISIQHEDLLNKTKAQK